MPKLPAKPSDHPLVDLIFRAWEEGRRGREQAPHRWHLGGSQLGKECDRQLWYGFRWAHDTRGETEGRMLRLFDRGDREEPAIVSDLRAVGAEVAETDPGTGAQWNFRWHGGHLAMSLDALIQELPEAAGFDPAEVYVGEFKTASAKRWGAMFSKGIRESDPVYYAQCQLGIHAAGVERALFVAVNKDTDAIYVEVIEREEGVAERLLARGARIVDAQDPPQRISEDPTFYKCRFCDFRDVCHYGKAADVNCRTCAHSTPVQGGETGDWGCAQGREEIAICVGCPSHVFHPGLVRLEPENFDGKAIEYADGSATVANGEGAMPSADFARHLDETNPLLP